VFLFHGFSSLFSLLLHGLGTMLDCLDSFLGHFAYILLHLLGACFFFLVSPIWKVLGWSLPAIILASLGAIAWNKGCDVAGDNIIYWILANGIPSSIGAMLALAHPLTIVSAFAAAPVTSLTPVIGAGYVTAFVQVLVQPPVVREFETVLEDMSTLIGWWKNKLLKVFLAFLLPGLGSMIGSWIGGYEIISNLF